MAGTMHSDAALASLRSAAGNCTRNRAGFTEQQRADGMRIVDELRSLFTRPGMAMRTAALPQRPSLVESLPAELLAAVFGNWTIAPSSDSPRPAGSCTRTGRGP
jgi:hypothetical protein